jgi:SAM-dependent methyltransferase
LVPAFSASRLRFFGCLVSAALSAVVAAQGGTPRVVFVPFEDARPALQLLAHLLPNELREKNAASLESFWPQWVRQSDAGIRARLAQGDEDSLVNLLLFGTSFTKEPRITARQIETILTSSSDPSVGGASLDRLTQSRLDDFTAAVAAPRRNERFDFARAIFEAQGDNPDTSEGRARIKARLLHALGRVLKEIDTNSRIIDRARALPDPGAEFAERSKLYRARGLSSDTSLLPNFAVEEALKAMRAGGVLTGPIKRVAVIGPGLDFADKLEGYDFYPQQTLQPFAIVDSLLRAGLSTAGDIRVTTFDLSPRVNAHLNRLRARAREGQPYVVQLPLDTEAPWSSEVVRYWAAFGDRIGAPAAASAVPASAGALKVRAVGVRPAVAAGLTSLDLNVVLQRLEVPAAEKFDLIVGTNVFLYYDEFQQALAMANIQQMLRPGGVLLSNNALVELPSSRVHLAGHTTLVYSARKDSGDTIVWYKCAE